MSIPRWRLFLFLALGLAILSAVVVGTGVIYVRQNVAALIQRAAAQQGVALSIGSAQWQGHHALRLSRVQIGPEGRAVHIGSVQVRWTWRDLLLNRRIDAVVIESPQIWMNELSELLASLPPPKNPASSTSKPWTIGNVQVSQGLVNLTKLRPGLPSIPIQFGRERAIEFHELPLGSGLSALGDILQEAEAHDILITSPFDPLTKVLHFETIKLQFTWAGLARNEVKELELIAPTIYLGPDLFWLADQMQAQSDAKKSSQSVSTTEAEAWKIERLSLRGGQLIVSAFGEPGVTLPFLFESEAPNVRLDRIQELSLKSQIKIVPQLIEYPSYQLSLDLQAGDIKLNLPLTDTTAKNLVPTVHFKRVLWRDIETTEAWASFTFNQRGIFGNLGGKAYQGYLNGEFQVLFQSGYPWNAQAYVTKVQTQPIVEKLTRDRFKLELSGLATGRVGVKAQSTKILETTADLHLQPPGQLRIHELQRLIDDLPADWNNLKRTLATSLTQSFKDYTYTKADASLRYALPESQVRLELWGDKGHRTLNLRWFQDPTLPPMPDYTAVTGH